MKRIAAFAGFVDRLNDAVGRGISWLTFFMVVAAFAVALLRYGFSLGWVWMQESYVWMHGALFMAAAGYTLLCDEHVRVDIFYSKASFRFKNLVNLGGALLLLLPTVSLIAFYSGPYIFDSWSKHEQSVEAGGLPAIYLLKSFIWLFCLLTGLQGLSLAFRSWLRLAGQDKE